MGLEFTPNIFIAVLTLVPTTFLFIGIGFISGALLTDKRVGGVCGALLTNVCAFLGGFWFDVELVGGTFRKFANALPFMHAVNVGRAALVGDFQNIFPSIWIVLGYGILVFLLAVFSFRHAMKKQQ